MADDQSRDLLATYRDGWRWGPLGQRTYCLYGDHLKIEGRSTTGGFDSVIMLSHLRLPAERRWYRRRTFALGIVLFLLSVGLMALAMNLNLHPRALRWAYVGLGSATIFWLVTAILSLPKIETAFYFNASSGTAELAVAKTGWRRERFDHFVTILNEQIAKVHSASAR
jgi:hypothetical protein